MDSLVLFAQILTSDIRHPFLRCLLPLQYNGAPQMFLLGTHSIEKEYLRNLAGPSFSRNSTPLIANHAHYVDSFHWSCFLLKKQSLFKLLTTCYVHYLLEAGDYPQEHCFFWRNKILLNILNIFVSMPRASQTKFHSPQLLYTGVEAQMDVTKQ